MSATILAGKIGVANFFYGCYRVNYVIEDDRSFGLFEAPIRPIGLFQALGAAMLLAGLIITQVTNGK